MWYSGSGHATIVRIDIMTRRAHLAPFIVLGVSHTVAQRDVTEHLLKHILTQHNVSFISFYLSLAHCLA